MINRRDFARGAGVLAAAASIGASPALARTARVAAPVPPVGPWTAFGKLRRAGGVLNYATLGPQDSGKPPVVLLHKLGGWMADWRFVAPALAQGRHVIAFDLPGHGGSKWDGPVPYIQTLSESAALLIGALDELGIDKIDLLGTSLGGCVGVVLAALWPERVNRLAVVSSALARRRSLAEVKVGIDQKQTALYDKNGLPVPTPRELLKSIFGTVHTSPIWEEGVESRKAAGLWIQPSERGVAVTDLPGALKRIEAPTLLVYGQFDNTYLRFRAAAEAALRNSRTEIVPDAGSFVVQDNPQATAAVLSRFINPV
jgi:pimeloyl-ACP methyl ester carboxylesterase